MDREEAKEYIKANPEIYFQTFGLAKDGGYICPICQNGTGKDGTGIKEIPRKKGVYKCFKCDFSGDVFGFIAKENNFDIKSDFPKVMDIACNIYGISVENNNSKNKREYSIKYSMKHSINKKDNKSSVSVQETASAIAETDYTDFFNEAAKHIHETDYLTKRGIREELQKEFKIGYDSAWRHPTNPSIKPSTRVIIPTSKNSYLARATDGVENYKSIKAGNIHIFNVEILEEDSRDPIFVCEGEIDALSIIEVGGQAVGLGGISSVSLFIIELEKRKKQTIFRPLLICLDNDAAGKKAAKELEEKLKQKGYFYRNVCEELLVDGKNEAKNHKDPNEALVGNREVFLSAVSESIKEGERLLLEREENSRQHNWERMRAIFDGLYVPKTVVSTGFKALDEILGSGLYAGLYVMAATSGAGKTTFALQIADYMAKNEQDVLFFSGEMTASEMLAKSLSRISKQVSNGDYSKALFMRTIHNVASSNNSDYKDLLVKLYHKHYADLARRLFIYDEKLEIGDLTNKIEEHKRDTGKSPVVFIDYLQILGNSDAQAQDRRLKIDDTVSRLRKLAAEHDTPVFVISSLNREAYGREKGRNQNEQTPASERELVSSDLKESGGIEYAADVILTLFAEPNSTDQDSMRKMKLKVIKNRTGRIHKKDEYISLTFVAPYNYFEDNGAKTEKDKGNRAQIAGSDPKKIE